MPGKRYSILNQRAVELVASNLGREEIRKDLNQLNQTFRSLVGQQEIETILDGLFSGSNG